MSGRRKEERELELNERREKELREEKEFRGECKSLILPESEGRRELNRHEVGDHFTAPADGRGTQLSPNLPLHAWDEELLSTRITSNCAAGNHPRESLAGVYLSLCCRGTSLPRFRELTAQSNGPRHKSRLGRVNKRRADTCARVLGPEGQRANMHTSYIKAKSNKADCRILGRTVRRPVAGSLSATSEV